MLAQREHDYFAETVICANCYIVVLIFIIQLELFRIQLELFCELAFRFHKDADKFRGLRFPSIAGAA